ncbi:Asp-tRNA(Asn) amidotransferase subunit GatC [Sulfuracidifex metallicus]|jgi:aspartyl-tRNA(Asn)/glutamyl-tRNA(Gln) amidotransferase subunit C|uniref:Aspartyl/glutamyl-tRNA(Asn/Gln) amidotransferase subunit C n=1 Tax=Sulfuracidifex metallicus DSM 6482 = JCM 9184 TaxID=523847 RepID=A0A6A9QIE7_SULME|nr:Asp-tRNA(Asn) amidotransferase subunit GatC [Sulfuracidifex metallicus]MCY0849586.1 Asp-tRNA(Asn) amidotransferase subunit GatC [Sulfuracidifex metallicus]MUN28000.1 Asp-tRNA(Asn) amidotransferase subunit GatC [Sulfuracidifex metallicus DSM 6482 = JCM 9184]WOE51453.1 Asp-tRNA(Asn) amidotransferase subunit GatC [Sulfuracidifex metallicus DSM 6482 = JCM 9184]
MKVEVNDELINKLERLSLITLTDKERERIKNDVKQILDFFNKLNDANLDNIEPLFHPLPAGKLREDKPSPGLTRDEALSNVKRKENGYIVGPRTYGD